MSEGNLAVHGGGLAAVVEGLADDGPLPDREGLVLAVGRADGLEDRLVAAGVPAGGVEVSRVEEWARERVAAERGQRVDTLSGVVRERAIRAAVRDAESGAVARLADRVGTGGSGVEVTARELTEYYRCTDAATEDDHEALLSAVESVEREHPFAAAVTRESVRAFRNLDRRLRRFVAEGDDAGRTFVSESHLLRAARGLAVEHDWVLVVPHDPVDASVLRTVVALAEEARVTLLTEEERLVERATAIAQGLEVEVCEEPTEEPASEPARRVLAAAHNRETTAHRGVQVVAAPDRRREVEDAVRVARRDEGRTLLVAPDPDAYAHALRDVALTANRPHRVGAAERVGALPAARALRALLAVVIGATDDGAAGGTVAAGAIVDALRLGVVPPDRRRTPGGERDAAASTDGRLPSLSTVDRLREALPDEGSLSAHRERVESAEAVSGALSGVPEREVSLVVDFVDWVESLAGSPPVDGRELRATLVAAVEAYAGAIRERAPARPAGIAVETDRALATAEHPTGAAAHVRTAVERRAGAAYDRLRGVEKGWEAARTALRAALSVERRPPATDADALELLAVGDPAAAVGEVDHLVVFGLSAERFPRASPRSTLLHRAVREAVARGEAGPAAVLGSETARYRRDLAALARTLRSVAAGGRVTLSRPYKDEEGRDVPPSPILDALTVPERHRERIALSEWTPADGTATATDVGGDGVATTSKDRLRALARHAETRTAARETLDDLAAGVDPGDARRLLRRVDRFAERLESEDE
jgi:hypothetical protein